MLAEVLDRDKLNDTKNHTKIINHDTKIKKHAYRRRLHCHMYHSLTPLLITHKPVATTKNKAKETPKHASKTKTSAVATGKYCVLFGEERIFPGFVAY